MEKVLFFFSFPEIHNTHILHTVLLPHYIGYIYKYIFIYIYTTYVEQNFHISWLDSRCFMKKEVTKKKSILDINVRPILPFHFFNSLPFIYIDIQKTLSYFSMMTYQNFSYLVSFLYIIDKPHTSPQLIMKGLKPATCFICGKTFANQSRCNRHLVTHSQIRPYKCSFCSKAFHRSDNLKVHERSHTSTEKFFCSKCGRCYSWRANMTKHERTCKGWQGK